MDRQWIKILAQSYLDQGQWRPRELSAPREHSQKQLSFTIARLFQELKEAVLVFNEHAKKEKKLSIFPVLQKTQEKMSGFVLVIGRIQLNVQQTESRLEMTLTRLQGFHQKTDSLHSCEAQVDPFGGISWIMDRKSIMTEDMLVKQLLHDICHEAHQSEW